MTSAVFITGNSSGLGYALTKEYLQRGCSVYGLSRRGCRGLAGDLHDIECDLARHELIVPALERLLGDVAGIDLVFLNAGVLGEIREISTTPLADVKRVMDINLWANKVILDWLHARALPIDQIVLVSSGAAVHGSKGWGAYALSKAALNMLTQLYAHEFPQTHLCALAPGLVDTAMQAYLSDPRRVDARLFPGVQRLRDARGTPDMPSPDAVARRIAARLPRLKRHPSGSFQDLRSL